MHILTENSENPQNSLKDGGSIHWILFAGNNTELPNLEWKLIFANIPLAKQFYWIDLPVSGVTRLVYCEDLDISSNSQTLFVNWTNIQSG